MAPNSGVGFDEAFSTTIARVAPLYPVTVPVGDAVGLVTAREALASVNCPSKSTATKDGYAVVSNDLIDASESRPRRLELVGVVFAGAATGMKIQSGWAVKVATGAVLPEGADAVIAREHVQVEGGTISCQATVDPWQNVLARGTDIAASQQIAPEGKRLTPAMTGLLAAGGVDKVRVYPKPKVGIIATGSEVVLPGWPLEDGQLYASNLITLLSWLHHFGMQGQTTVVPDDAEALRQTIDAMLSTVDAVVTIGGAWKGDRDLTVGIMDEIADDVLYRGVRIRPGKSAALGLVGPKPVFCLPGSPSASEMAFLELALPGLRCMAGGSPVTFDLANVRVDTPIKSDVDWTELLHAKLYRWEGALWASPLKLKSRLRSMANAQAIIRVPEGVAYLGEGDEVEVRILFGRSVIKPGKPNMG